MKSLSQLTSNRRMITREVSKLTVTCHEGNYVFLLLYPGKNVSHYFLSTLLSFHVQLCSNLGVPTIPTHLHPLPGICSIYSTSVHSPSDHLLCFFPSVPVIFSFCPSVSCYDPLPALCTPACLPQPLLDTCVSSPLPTWLLPVFKFELASLVSGSCFWVRTCFD